MTTTKTPTSRLELLHALSNVKVRTTIVYREFALVIERQRGRSRSPLPVWVSLPGIEGSFPATTLTEKLDAIKSLDQLITLIQETLA